MKLYVAEARNKRRMSLQELSDKSGVAKSYIQKLEEGNANPSICVLCKIAKALNVPVETLFSCK